MSADLWTPHWPVQLLGRDAVHRAVWTKRARAAVAEIRRIRALPTPEPIPPTRFQSTLPLAVFFAALEKPRKS